jgi:hypothetical protein
MVFWYVLAVAHIIGRLFALNLIGRHRKPVTPGAVAVMVVSVAMSVFLVRFAAGDIR